MFVFRGLIQRSVFRGMKHIKSMSSKHNKKIGIVGCPFSKGQQIRGPELAPKAIRDAGLIYEIHNFNGNIKIEKHATKYLTENLQLESLDVLDYGNVDITDRKYLPDYPKNMRNYGQFVGTVRNLATKVEEILNNDRMVITLGGDHSVGIGSIGGHLKYNKDIAVIWVDAHADINTNLTSYTGNIHGMAVGMLAKELEEYWPPLPEMEWLQNKLSLNNIVYIGLRSVDPLEKLIASKFNISVYGMEDIDKCGIYHIIERALKDIDPENKKHYHVSYDIDSLDGLEAPSTGTRVRGGLSLREGICIMEEIYKTGRLEAVDLVEVNPAIGSEDAVKKTVDAAIQILKAACGTVRSGVVPIESDIPKPEK